MNILVLENIRSAHNVGSIFRTADAVGIDRIILAGHTPAPIDRFGRKRKDIAKTALGAEESVSWEKIEDLLSYIKQVEGQIHIIEQTPQSKDYKEYKKEEGDTYFIFGNEVEGVTKEVCDIADSIYEIPMRGTKESLNVSVAVGVFLFEALK